MVMSVKVVAAEAPQLSNDAVQRLLEMSDESRASSDSMARSKSTTIGGCAISVTPVSRSAAGLSSCSFIRTTERTRAAG